MARASGPAAGAAHLIVAAAIVAGSALIAAGLYFGLRDRAAPASGEHGAARGAATEPAGQADAPPADAAPALGPEIQTQVELEVREALEAARPAMVERCWRPAAARAPEPARARYLFHIAVGADGRELARGVSEFRDAARPEVGRCLRELSGPKVQVSPPGETVAVEVTLTLPE